MAPGGGAPVAWSGVVFDGVETFEGFVLHDGHRILELGEGPPPVKPAVEGLVVPAPVNAHTHVGDTALRGRLEVPKDLADAVGPPHGAKHRGLATMPRPLLAAGIRQALIEAADDGTLTLGDFREGGVDGLALLEEAREGRPHPAVVAFGRATGPDPSPEDLDDVLSCADGLGLSGLGDATAAVRDLYAAACRRAGKSLALHFAEAVAEDVSAALALEPAFVVHASCAGRRELRALADAGVGLVVCPRSNARFGLQAPVAKALEVGLPFAIGTDNGWFHAPSVWTEVAFLAEHTRAPPELLLASACVHGRKALSLDASVPLLGKGRTVALAALALPAGADIGAALRAGRVVATVRG